MTADLADFPVLVLLTDTNLAASARSDAADLVFTGADGTTPLAHEIESYTSSNGAVVAWVKLPNITAFGSTPFFLYYGNPNATDRQSPPSVWDSGFRAVWHFSEAAGSSLSDSSSNANTGTFGNSPYTPAWTTGGIGNAAAFDGVDDYLTLPHSTSLDVSGTAFSVSGWFLITNSASDQVIFGKLYHANGDYPWYQYGVEFQGSTDKVMLYLGGGDASMGPWGVSPTLGTWQYIAFTYDGSQVKRYLNGNAALSSSETRSITARPTDARMGAYLSASYPFSGRIDELRLSSVTRSAAWLGAEYRNHSSPSTFVTHGTQEIQTAARLTFSSVNGGAPVTAGVPFSVTVGIETATGATRTATHETSVTLAVASGSGSLSGTLTGTLDAGSGSVTFSGLSTTNAQSALVLVASRTSGDALTAGDSSPFAVAPGAVSTSRSTVSALPSTVEANADDAATVTVTLRDAHDNAVSGKSVTLSKSGGDSTITTVSGSSDTDGFATFEVRSATAETTTYTASVAADAVTIAQTATVAFEHTPWFHAAWPYRKAVTIPGGQLAGNLTNFPALVRHTDSHLATYARSDARDLVFTAADGVTPLAHELDRYVSSEGTVEAWVRIPSLSPDGDSRVFMYYGRADASDQASPPDVWDSDFRAVWHASEASGTTLGDSTTHTNTATFAGGSAAPTWSTDAAVGRSLAFDGSNDFLTLPHSEALDIHGTEFTVSAWVRISDTGGDSVLFGKFHQPTMTYPYYQYGVEFDSDADAVDLYLGTTDTLLGPFSVRPETNAWQHVAFTYDGTEVRGYVNGTNQLATSQTASIASLERDLRFGRDINGNQPYWGKIDELRLSSVARSPAWIDAEYRNMASGTNFATVSTAEGQTLPKLSVDTIEGGASVVAGSSFSVVVRSLTAAGAAYPVPETTTVLLDVAAGSSTLGGTVTGILPAGGTTITFSGLTYTRAESGVAVLASSTSGTVLTAGESPAFQVVAGAVANSTSTVGTYGSVAEANGIATATVVVTLRDAYQNPVSGHTVTLSALAGSSAVSASSGPSDDDGLVTFRVRDTTEETVTYAAVDTTASLALTSTTAVTFVHTPWYNGSWSHRKTVTLVSNRVAGPLANFPVLVRDTDASVGARARTNGFDLLFTAADGTTKLAHEIESYTPSTGALVAWVKVPSLTPGTNTTLFLYYGNSLALDQQDASDVWDEDYVAVWHLKETPMSAPTRQILDSTANANHGTPMGSMDASDQVPGAANGSLSFDGTNDRVKVPNSPSLGLTNAATIQAWYRLDGLGTWRSLVCKGLRNNVESQNYFLEFDTDNHLLYGFSNGSTYHYFTSASTFEDTNSLHQIVLAWNGSQVDLYHDGAWLESNARTITPGGNSASLLVGYFSENADPFAGILDEVRVSRVARSAEWIATEHANITSPSSFHDVAASEALYADRLSVTSVHSGASPDADTPFSVVVESRNPDASPRTVSEDTVVVLTLSAGSGALGGTVTGVIPAGSHSASISGVTYRVAEGSIVLTAVRVSGDDLASGDSAPFTVTHGVVATGRSGLAVDTSRVEANDLATATVIVTLRDAYDNAVSGKTVALQALGGSSTIVGPDGVTDAAGRVRFTVRDAVEESVEYSALDTTDGVAPDGTVTVTFAKSRWHNASWLRRKALVIPSASITAPLTHFPVLVSLADSDLMTFGRTNAYDILFTSGNGTNRLSHEIESYASSNGTLVAWVNVDSLATNVENLIFLYYGHSQIGDRQSVTGTWNSGYGAVWHLNQSIFSDSTANANTGSNSGTTNVTGRIAEGRRFDGVNDTITTTTRYTAPQTFTLEAWFKTTTASGKNILSYESSRTGTGSSTWDRQVYVGTDGKVHFECWSGVSDVASSPLTYADGNWHHVAAVRSDGDASMVLYLDGTEVDAISSPAAESANSYWRIGSYKPGSLNTATGYFPGDIDEVRISFEARSAEWIAAQYANQSAPSTFYAVSAAETNTLPRLAVVDVNGGADVRVGVAFPITLQAQSAAGVPQVVTNDTAVTLSIATGGGILGGTYSGTLTAGTASVVLSAVTYTKAESGVVLTATASGGDNLVPGDSAAFTVVPGALAKLQLLLPGETADPGSVAGKTGTPTSQTAGTDFSATVHSVDAHWNVVATNHTVAITSSDANAQLPSATALSSGTASLSVTLKTAGTATLTASDTTDGNVQSNTSPSVTVAAGVFNRLLLLMPGESIASGTTTGKSGSPTTQTAGTAFSVTVRAVDALWNPVSSRNTVRITSSDAYATLPPNAALSSGSRTFSVTLKTAGTSTLTASNVTAPAILGHTGTATTVQAGSFTKLQTLLPGETAVPGSPTGKSGSPTARTAGTAFDVTVRSVDANWNLVASTDVVAITSNDANATLPSPAALVAGAGAFSTVPKTAGTATFTATDASNASITAGTSASVTVNAGSLARLQLLIPGETAAPGTTTGKTGTPTTRTAGTSFNVTVRSVDAQWNLVSSTHTVAVTSGDAYAVLPANTALSAGSKSLAVTLKTAGTTTVTASDVSQPSVIADTSPVTSVSAGALNRLQILVPGETAVPGSTTGKSGSPTTRTAGEAFDVTIRAVDAQWNPVSTNDTVALVSSDSLAVLPASAALVSGTRTASVTLKTAGAATLTASNLTHTTITANTSPSLTVIAGAATRLAFATQPAGAAAGSHFSQQPVVRIEDTWGNASTSGVSASLTVTITLFSGTGPLQGTPTLDIGTASGNGTGTFSDLRLDPSGSKVLSASATGLSDAISASFEVANVAPTVDERSFDRPRNVTVKLLVSELLNLATDANGDSVTFAGITATSSQGAALHTNATHVLYGVPPAGNVADQFTFTVSDGQLTSTGTVRITLRSASSSTNLNRIAFDVVAGKPTVTFAGIPGHPYFVERTLPPLASPTWTRLLSTNAPAHGRIRFVDDDPPAGEPIYRASEP